MSYSHTDINIFVLQVKDGSLRDTQFVISTSQASRLPIVDFASYDLAGEIEVEVGQVCFW